MHTVKIIASNTMAQMVAKIATMSSTLVIIRLIANPEQGLGRAGYTDYGIIMAFAAYFYIVADFGLNAIVVKDVAQDRSKTAHYIANLLSLRIVLSIGLIMIGLIGLSFIGSTYSPLIRIGIVLSLITIVSQSVITTTNAYFQASLQYWQSTIAVVVGSAVSLCLAALVYAMSGPLLGYVAASLVGSATMALMGMAMVRLQVPIGLGTDRQLWRSLLASAWPLGLAVIFNLIYIRSGFFILSLVGQEQYGLLDGAYRLFDIAITLPVFIVNALYPLLISKLQSGWSEFSIFFGKAMTGLLGISLVVAIGLWVAAPLAIKIIFNNPEFDQSVTIVRWLCALIPIFFATNLLLWTTITLGRRKSVILFYVIGAVVSLSLNVWLVPQFGYWAVLGVTGLTETLIGLMMAGQLGLIWRSRSSEKPPVDPVNPMVVEEATLS